MPLASSGSVAPRSVWVGEMDTSGRSLIHPTCDRLGLDVGEKRLLHFSPSGTVLGEIEAIAAAGWQVTEVVESRRATQLLAAGKVDVGLYLFADSAVSGIEKEIDDLLSSAPMVPWVGVLDRDLTDQGRIAHLLTRYFFDFHTLPVDSGRLLITLGHACGMARLYKRLLDQPGSRIPGGEVIGDTRPMQALIRSIERVANVDAPVLISGESGTGKELVARSIHSRSHRAEGPFVAVNCGALPASLIQAELFGHEKGAFTGADRRRMGRLEAADGGTLFLDEIADLPLELQVNLLRCLEENTIERVGSIQPIPVDVRVIAASHVNLETAVAKGNFRDDLYFRINVLQIDIPRLAERGSDIHLLAKHFFQLFVEEKGLRIRGFSHDALDAMARHPWPGNVRELINRVRRAVVMADGQLITAADLGLGPAVSEESLTTLAQARAEAEERAIRTALARNAYSATGAARSLGIARASLYRLMTKYGIRR